MRATIAATTLMLATLFTVPAFSGNANANVPVSPSGSVSLDITQNGGPLTITRDAGACAFSSIDALGPDVNFNAGPVITPDQITGTINAPDQPFEMSITMICT